MTYGEHFSVTKDQFDSEIERLISSGDWRINRIAKRMGYSQVTISKFCLIYFGMTVNHYINKKRLELGRNMLLSGGYSVAEVARHLGITRTHFSREYIKHYGVRASTTIPKE